MKDETLPMSYYRALKEVRDLIPENAMLVAEGANTMDISRSIVPTFHPRHRSDAGTFGTMGIGIPFCIASALHAPNTPIVAIQGDSAFGFSAMELEVAFRLKLPMTIIIINNNGIYDGVEKFVEGIPPPPNCLLPSAHYEKIAEAFGGKGFFVTEPRQLRAALIEAFKQPLPSIVNVMINPESKRKEQKFDWHTRSKL